MPFVSCDQERAIFAKDPKLAESWAKKYGSRCKGVKKHDTEMKAQNDHLRNRKK